MFAFSNLNKNFDLKKKSIRDSRMGFEVELSIVAYMEMKICQSLVSINVTYTGNCHTDINHEYINE